MNREIIPDKLLLLFFTAFPLVKNNRASSKIILMGIPINDDKQERKKTRSLGKCYDLETFAIFFIDLFFNVGGQNVGRSGEEK